MESGKTFNPSKIRMNRLEEIVNYANLAQNYGFVPIPIQGKVPRFRDWQRVRFDPNDPQKNIRRIEHLFKARLADNIGIITGEASGVVVLDIDKGSVEWWNELTQLNPLPETFTVQTGNQGLHIYFKYEPRVSKFGNMNKILGQNIDFRTNGGQAIFPGSIHSDTGKYYEVISGYRDGEGDERPIIAPMPDWMIELLDLDRQQKSGRR